MRHGEALGQKGAHGGQPFGHCLCLDWYANVWGYALSADGESEQVDFEHLVKRCSPSMLRLAALLVADRAIAEDVLQTALLNVYRNWSQIRSAVAADAYVRKAVVRTALNWRTRHRPRTSPLPEGVGNQEASSTPAQTQSVVDRLWLWPLVINLPARQRAVLVLRYYEDLTEAQTAEVLDMTVGTVKSHHARAIKRLRRATAETQVSPTVPTQSEGHDHA